MLAELVVADQRAKRLAAEDPEFIFIDFLEHYALVELRSALQVTQQLFLADVEDANLKHRTGFALTHHVLDAAPAGFQLLKRRMVKDFVQLKREKMVDLRNARIDGGVGVARKLHLAFKNLRNELLDHVAATLTRGALAPKSPLLYDLIQQARFGGLSFRGLCGRLLRIADSFHQEVVQLVVSLQSAAEISELLAQVEKFAQGLDVLCDIAWVKIIQTLEINIHFDLSGVGLVTELIVNFQRQMRLETFQHAVEVVGSNLHKAAVFQLRESFRGLAAKVGQDTHDKWQLFDFNGVTNFYIVGYVYSWRAYPLQLLMDAFFCHVFPLSLRQCG